jgi:hypothetical protein
MRNLTSEQQKQRLKLYASGMIDARIADAEGITRRAITSWRRWHGLPPNDCPSRQFAYGNAAKKALMLERIRLIQRGWTDAAIALHQQRTPASIFGFRKIRGLAQGPGTLDDRPMVISYDHVVGDRYRADPSWSNWLEEMGATVW